MTDEADDTPHPFTVLEGGKGDPETIRPGPPDGEQLDDEQLAELALEHRKGAIAQLFYMLTMLRGSFAANFPEEELPKLAGQLIDEQLDLINPQILPSMMDPKTSKPLIMIEVVCCDDGNKCMFPAYKRLEGIRDPQLAAPHAMLYAFLTTPLARALLRMHGFVYNFVQANDPSKAPPRPRIITR